MLLSFDKFSLSVFAGFFRKFQIDYFSRYVFQEKLVKKQLGEINYPIFSRPGSGRGGEQQYNAWDRSSRPGSGRGLNNSSASPGCVSASSNSSTPSMSPTSPSSSSAGGQLGLVPEHRIRNIVPPTNLPIVPGSKIYFFTFFKYYVWNSYL